MSPESVCLSVCLKVGQISFCPSLRPPSSLSFVKYLSTISSINQCVCLSLTFTLPQSYKKPQHFTYEALLTSRNIINPCCFQTKTVTAFDEWVSRLRHHRLYRQHEMAYGTRDAPRLTDVTSPVDDLTPIISPISPAVPLTNSKLLWRHIYVTVMTSHIRHSYDVTSPVDDLTPIISPISPAVPLTNSKLLWRHVYVTIWWTNILCTL